MDEIIREFLMTPQKIAVVGMSPDPSQPSRYVPEFLEEKGHEIIPIHPVLEEIGHWKPKKKLEDVKNPTAVIIYLSQRNVDRMVKKAIELNIPLIWLPLGITTILKKEAEFRGITLIQDKCPKIEWNRLAKKYDHHK